MRLNELMDALGELFLWTFGILEHMENKFNWFIIVVMFLLGVIWVKKMFDFNREAARNGTLK